MAKRLLKKSDAAAYLGMSEPSFDEHVRPYVVPRLIKRGPQRHFCRYDVRDLDAWADTLPTLAPADARERPQEDQAGRMERINNSGWRNACRLAGLPIRVHDLRHTFGARLEAAGVPWEYRKVLLGHTVHDVTAHYSAPGLARLLQEAEKVTRQTALIVLRGAQSAPIAKRQPRKAAVSD